MTKRFTELILWIFFFVLAFSPVVTGAEELSDPQADDVIILDQRDYYNYFFVPGTYSNVVSYNVRFYSPTFYPDDLYVSSTGLHYKSMDGSYHFIPLNSKLSSLPLDDIELFYVNRGESFSLSTKQLATFDSTPYLLAIIFLLGGAIICRSFK